MPTAESIYPIAQLYFQCEGCKAEWMIRPDPPILNVIALKAFTNRGDMGPCPKTCGSRTVSMIFKASLGTSTVDPFSLFDKKDVP